MQLKRLPIILLLVLATILTLSMKTIACSCAPERPPCEAFAHSSAVFIGLVTNIKITDNKHDRKGLYKIKVEEVFLGTVADNIEAVSSGIACGYEFQEGKRYLIYIRGDRKDKYFVTYCSRTRPIEKADEDLKFLRNELSKLNGARIHVDLIWDVQSHYSLPKERRDQPPGKVRIKMEGQNGRYDLVSDEKGIVEVSGLNPGIYSVEITPPEGTKVIGRNSQWLYSNGRGCSKLSLVISNQR